MQNHELRKVGTFLGVFSQKRDSDLYRKRSTWQIKKPHLTERFDGQNCECAAKCRSDNIDTRFIANSVSNANRHGRLCNENSPRFLRGCSLGLMPNGLMPLVPINLPVWPVQSSGVRSVRALDPLDGSVTPPAHGG